MTDGISSTSWSQKFPYILLAQFDPSDCLEFRYFTPNVRRVTPPRSRPSLSYAQLSVYAPVTSFSLYHHSAMTEKYEMQRRTATDVSQESNALPLWLSLSLSITHTHASTHKHNRFASTNIILFSSSKTYLFVGKFLHFVFRVPGKPARISVKSAILNACKSGLKPAEHFIRWGQLRQNLVSIELNTQKKQSVSRSQWPSGLRRGSGAERLLG